MKNYLMSFNVDAEITKASGGRYATFAIGALAKGVFQMTAPKDVIDRLVSGKIVASGELTEVWRWNLNLIELINNGKPVTFKGEEIQIGITDEGERRIVWEDDQSRGVILLSTIGSPDDWTTVQITAVVRATSPEAADYLETAEFVGTATLLSKTEVDDDQPSPEPSPDFDFAPEELRPRTLWKPVSGVDGKLIVLFTKLLKKKLAFVGLFKNGSLIEQGEFKGDVHNGERPHYRFSKAGGDYPNSLDLIAVTDSGWKVVYRISDSSERYDGQITPSLIKPDE